MPARPAPALGLRDGDRERLSSLVRSSTVRAGLAQRARIVLLAADGVSNTEIASRLKIGNATVARAWRDYGVQPWRVETFKFSTDPQLVAKVTDVVALYLAPPEDAIVLCIDELGRAWARHHSE